jgi:hypothetical protein
MTYDDRNTHQHPAGKRLPPLYEISKDFPFIGHDLTLPGAQKKAAAKTAA